MVGMYDFTSAHILETLEAQLRSSAASCVLTLDDPAKNATADQTDEQTVQALSNSLRSAFEQAWALVRSSPEANSWIFPTAYHIKVAVADDARVWLSSGNWNNSNQPDIDPWSDRVEADRVAKKSDRDWHVIIESRELARVFKAYLQHDFDVASKVGTALTASASPLDADIAQPTDAELQAMTAEMLLAAKAPVSYFEPLRLPPAGAQTVRVQPLLTPDPDVYTAHVLTLIRSAKSKFYLQTQYIHPSTNAEDQAFSDLIDAVIELHKSNVDVKIIVSQWQKMNGWLDRLLQTGIDPSTVRVQTGVHNKGIVVDSQAVMISSQNWSGDGVLRNRDAGVIIFSAEAAQYFEQVFLHDWDNLAVPVADSASSAQPSSTLPQLQSVASALLPVVGAPSIVRASRPRGHARFVMANRRAGKFGEARMASRQAINKTFGMIAPDVDVLHDHAPNDETARRVVVFEADADIQSAVTDPNVLLEPEILHWTDTISPIDLGSRTNRFGAPLPILTSPATYQIAVTGGGEPLANAAVSLYVRSIGGIREMKAVTGADGVVRFAVDQTATTSAIVVVPAGDYWTMVKRGPGRNEHVDCPRLPTGSNLEWWHRLFGLKIYDPSLGSPIKVGVIDTGCGPHGFLQHVVDVGAFVSGSVLPAPSGRDVDSHGTHVCGIIGARPDGFRFAGVAPGANLHCARVFLGPEQGANQGDIANAIDALSRDAAVDVINMSLGSGQPSQIEHDAIIDAYERGTVCVCAAGNDGGPVNWPAKFPECIAVSAIGVGGWGPDGSLAATRMPLTADRFGRDGFYLANFSCFGPELVCAGQGVGIISTVPERFGLKTPYLAMDGTSMASPCVTGALTVLLSMDAAFQALPRDRARADTAKAILRQSCVDLGLAIPLQGLGVPRLATAQPLARV